MLLFLGSCLVAESFQTEGAISADRHRAKSIVEARRALIRHVVETVRWATLANSPESGNIQSFMVIENCTGCTSTIVPCI